MAWKEIEEPEEDHRSSVAVDRAVAFAACVADAVACAVVAAAETVVAVDSGNSTAAAIRHLYLVSLQKLMPRKPSYDEEYSGTGSPPVPSLYSDTQQWFVSIQHSRPTSVTINKSVQIMKLNQSNRCPTF